MTEAEALAEARRRWGADAQGIFIEEPSVHPSERYLVGYRSARYL